MIRKNETWVQGAKLGDAPIESEDAPFTPDEIAQNERFERISNARRLGVSLAEVPQLLADLLEYLDIKG